MKILNCRKDKGKGRDYNERNIAEIPFSISKPNRLN